MMFFQGESCCEGRHLHGANYRNHFLLMFLTHNLASCGTTWIIWCRMSPMNFVVDPLENVIEIPWVLEGAFLMSLVGAHIIGAMLHNNPSRHFHLELALTGALVCIGIDSCITMVWISTRFFHCSCSTSWTVLARLDLLSSHLLDFCGLRLV